MKKNKLNIAAIIAIAAFVAGGFYLIGRESGSGSQSGSDNSIGSFDELVGKQIPSFSLRDKNGVEYSADNLRGKKVVLFFNEGIMCYPACWNQMVALASDPRFNDPDKSGVIALSVVIDRPADWQSAVRKMPELGKATIVFDDNGSVSRSLGMLAVPSSMHYGAFPGHSFVVIDRQGIIRFTLDDPNMAIDNDRIFAELEKLN